MAIVIVRTTLLLGGREVGEVQEINIATRYGYEYPMQDFPTLRYSSTDGDLTVRTSQEDFSLLTEGLASGTKSIELNAFSESGKQIRCKLPEQLKVSSIYIQDSSPVSVLFTIKLHDSAERYYTRRFPEVQVTEKGPFPYSSYDPLDNTRFDHEQL